MSNKTDKFKAKERTSRTVVTKNRHDGGKSSSDATSVNDDTV
jgi:hypothetical protein